MEENERVIRKLKITIEKTRTLAESYARQSLTRPNFGGFNTERYNNIVEQGSYKK